MARSPSRLSLGITVLAVTFGCDGGGQPAAAARDSAGAMVTEQEFHERRLAADTATGLASEPVRDSAAREPDGAAPHATAAELRDLARVLIVPVTGVTPAQLVGSFDDARGQRRHEALDIPAPRGTPVVSAAAGQLVKLHTSEFGGLMVYTADETERFVLLYAHLDRYASGLAEGMRLRRGQLLGYVGTTGNAPPEVPHLHFGIARVSSVAEWWRGAPVDPLPLLGGS
jgi:murein DD-endopeptidase MepM/ murein hydrolase activator NlpD